MNSANKMHQLVDLVKLAPVRKSLFVLIVSLPLLGMTELRLSCCGIGPGEALLLLWLAYILVVLIKEKTDLFESTITRVITCFWLFSLTVMAVGAYFGHWIMAIESTPRTYNDPLIKAWDYNQHSGWHLFHGPIHDTIAYLGMMLISVSLAAYKYTWKELQTAFVAVAVISTVLMYGLLLLNVFGVSVEPFSLVGTNTARFAGLAKNPNQAALLIIFVPLFITAFIESNEGRMSRAQKFSLALVLAMALVIGIETRSTAFRISIIFWFVVMLVLWIRLVIKKNTSLNPVIKVIALSLLLAFGLDNLHQPIKESTEIARTLKLAEISFAQTPSTVTAETKKAAEALKLSVDESLSTGLERYENAFSFRNKTADTLYVSHRPDFNFSGDFTIECWFFTPTHGGEHRLFSHWGYGGYIGGYSQNRVYALSRGELGLNAGHLEAPIPSANAWHHYAYTRSGSTYRLFIDGKEVDSVTESKAHSLVLDTPLVIGAQGKEYFWLGLIFHVNIISGDALYTENFTPPKPTGANNLLAEVDSFENLDTLQSSQKSSFKNLGIGLVSIIKQLVGTIIQKSEYRFKLYKNGYLALMASPYVGLGPGPYSGDDSPFHRREIHNSFFDWVLNTGILGGIAMITLFVWSAHRLWSKHCYSLFCALMTIGLFAQFHHVIRHPIIWIFLILCLKIAEMKDMDYNFKTANERI